MEKERSTGTGELAWISDALYAAARTLRAYEGTTESYRAEGLSSLEKQRDTLLVMHAHRHPATAPAVALLSEVLATLRQTGRTVLLTVATHLLWATALTSRAAVTEPGAERTMMMSSARSVLDRIRDDAEIVRSQLVRDAAQALEAAMDAATALTGHPARISLGKIA
jgi:hypothetical protein